jgi:hypothetical protein
VTAGENDGVREDERLARAFGRIADRQVARYARTYDLDDGLTRFADWLAEHTISASGSDTGATGSSLAVGSIAVAIKTEVEAIEVAFRPMSEQLVARADEAVTQLYSNHYRSLVRLAGLLVRDEPTAEEVVQIRPCPTSSRRS